MRKTFLLFIFDMTSIYAQNTVSDTIVIQDTIFSLLS